ncbi:hypothetical protein FACS1894199_09980 [Bacteroidia bacterium]|nr:hypothetical protein FACS1894199_09980 [Bacteroidia bacterium]
MERQVIFAEDVKLYLRDLSILLFERNYFSFPGDAKAYVDRMVKYMRTYIGILPIRPAPHYFSRYASDLYYITYHANQNTLWYGFYQQSLNIFIVRHITNSHIAAQYFV